MKKLKKLAALVLAAAMVLAMGMTSFAADAKTLTGNGKLTITGTTAGTSESPKTITLYQLFRAVPGTGNTATYTLNEEFEMFFTTNIESCKDKADAELSEAARAYVESLKGNAANQAAFAKQLLDWVIENASTLTNVSETVDATEGTTVIDKLAYGYYLVYPKGASVVSDTDPKTPAMLVPVNDATAEIKLKPNYPTVDKSVSSDDSDADTEIGKTVTFTLTSTVPDMTGYESYVFKFVDKLSAGLTFKGITSVKVGDQVVTAVNAGAEADRTYTLKQETVDTNKTQITITMNNFLNSYKDMVGQKIVVTYTATVNENAVVSGVGNADGNTNEAHVEYSNDPSNPTDVVPSTPDEVETYTFKFDLHKYAEGADTSYLENAEFELYRDEACKDKVELVADATTGGYRVKTDSDSGEATVIKTNNTKAVTISGLEDGEYWLKETKAPEGYNTLAEPVKITITPQYNGEGDLTNVTITYGEDSANAENGVVKIENREGGLLPETGGMGTVLFTVIGGVLLIAVIGSFVYSRKKSAK